MNIEIVLTVKRTKLKGAYEIMTETKLTPDDLAHAVKDLIQENGDCLTGLSFDTRDGGHNYSTVISRQLDGSSRAEFAT